MLTLFPGRERKEKVPVPDEILKDKVPKGKNYGEEEKDRISVQEERRLFYVGMTRARKLLYLTWARDYGLKRLKKVSPFVLEAFDLAKMPDEFFKTSALEEIRRYAEPASKPAIIPAVREKGVVLLSYFQVEDYLTCPLKYRYRHIMRIPVLPHHNLVFGRVLHSTIHFYLKERMSGKRIKEEELLKEYEDRWINEGFLSREHEEMRKKGGEKALLQFYRREEGSGKVPGLLEKNFRWQLDDIKFIGRWDRIDYIEEGAVIIDFKATEVKDQKEADKKTRDSLQMDLYALSFARTQDVPLLETRLYFLESDIVGHAQKKEKELERTVEKIKEVKTGILSQDYRAKPDWHNCSFCEFRTICPDSYAY
jgi:DNA helicase-2/ATP-dependent DNA helicase PcrA